MGFEYVFVYNEKHPKNSIIIIYINGLYKLTDNQGKA
jgi:hypothetical protein